MPNQRDIVANLDKVMALIKIKSSKKSKEVQSLIGCIAAPEPFCIKGHQQVPSFL